MKIIVLHPKVCLLSASLLAEAIGAEYENPFHTERKDYREYDLVINYGCNRNIKAKRLINNSKAVACCIDKLRTFTVLQEAGILTIPEFTTNVAKAKKWELVVVRKDAKGAGNEGLQFVDPELAVLPDAPLYTKYFPHHKEFRIVVVPESNGIMTCQAYEKVRNGKENWDFIPIDKPHLRDAKAQCIRAADALNIDYVGFDVLMNKAKHFIILEANSGPVLTDLTAEVFKKMLKNVV
jgi:glutathione synthase/RimK-type ligase-like ATP-grasp enzyme